ncbi:ScbR family autoregulator-binding transcription factor [Streptomyces xanthochromogenes]|uniref:ScbR family autoregulator-binding transcription factor n=1 Tax=Streptomyces xanthochromogenes TaxID=67384 RepID=UPI00342BF41F
MSRQERSIRTRAAILEAAARLFNEFGYEATTIGVLTERIGLTRGGLYFHFTSKEQLARGVLDEAVTVEGLRPQALKLQEWVDLALLIAYRLPREPILGAAIQLSVDPTARGLFGTRWPDWIALQTEMLAEAKQRGEVLPHIDPATLARLFVGAWTGVQLVTGTLENRTLPDEISSLLDLLLPSVASDAVRATLDTSPSRAVHLLAQARGSGDTCD